MGMGGNGNGFMGMGGNGNRNSRSRTPLITRAKQIWERAESLWVANPRNYSFLLARWQHRTDGLATICNCMF